MSPPFIENNIRHTPMLTDADPYQTPALSPDHSEERFASWSTFALLGIFFLPSLFLILTLVSMVFFKNNSLSFTGFCVTVASGIVVSFFSARVHTVRRQANFGTLFLFIFVYLLAQILALFITWFGIAILEPIFI